MNQGGGTSIKMNPTAVKGQMKGLLKGLRYISQIFGKSNLLFSQNFAYETSFLFYFIANNTYWTCSFEAIFVW
jgi:hypothetical protein